MPSVLVLFCLLAWHCPDLLRKAAWQQNDVCGANCLYLFLSLHGVEVSYEELRAALGQVPSGGFSAVDLQDVAKQIGLEIDLVRATAAEPWSSLAYPVIAHVGNGYADHWVVVLGECIGELKVVNGSNGQIEDVKIREFTRSWSGFLLVKRRSGSVRFTVAAALFALVSLLLLTSRYGRFLMLYKRFARTALPMAAVGFSIWIAGLGGVSAQQHHSPPVTEIATALSHWCEQVRSLPGIEVQYRLDCTQPDLTVDGIWARPWQEFRTLIDFRERRLLNIVRQPRNTFKQRDPLLEGKTESNAIGFDGRMVTIYQGLDVNSGRIACKELDAVLMRQLVSQLHYFEHLGLLLFDEHDQSDEANWRSRPKWHYWLPAALRENVVQYSVNQVPQTVDGVSCWVLDRPGVDRLWVQMHPFFLIRQRDTYWTPTSLIPGTQLRDTLRFMEPREVAPGVWLPQRIQVQHFYEPRHGPALAGKVRWQHDLHVSRLEPRAIAQEEYLLNVKPGTEVHDYFTHAKGNVFLASPNANPFEVIAGNAETQAKLRSYGIVAAVLLVMIIGVWFWLRSRRASSPLA